MRPPPTSLADAATTIATTTSNVLICDTCSLLDIVRLPVREDDPARLTRTLAALASIEAKVASRQVIIVCPEPVPLEWNNNVAQPRSEAKNHLEYMARIYSLLTVFAQTQGVSLPPCPITPVGITAFLHDLAERLLDASIVLKRDNSVSLRAIERAVLSTPPARKGAVKDCIIYEHMLELFSLLTSSAHTTKRVLLTSNVNDFCVNGNAPKPPIDVELATHNAVLRTSWVSAEAEF